jgi:flagellar protein FliS
MFANGYNVYKNNSINYASKEQLLLMLTEGAVKFSKIARQAIIEKDIQKAHNTLIRLQDIFTELMISIDTTQGEWAENLFSVYEFIKTKLIDVNLSKDLSLMEEVMPLIEDVNNIWQEAYKQSIKSR